MQLSLQTGVASEIKSTKATTLADDLLIKQEEQEYLDNLYSQSLGQQMAKEVSEARTAKQILGISQKYEKLYPELYPNIRHQSWNCLSEKDQEKVRKKLHRFRKASK